MKATYEKYKDTETGTSQYEITLPNGTKHWASIELGNYIHQLEQKLNLSNILNKMVNKTDKQITQTQFEIEETLRNEMAAKEDLQRRNNIMDKF